METQHRVVLIKKNIIKTRKNINPGIIFFKKCPRPVRPDPAVPPAVVTTVFGRRGASRIRWHLVVTTAASGRRMSIATACGTSCRSTRRRTRPCRCRCSSRRTNSWHCGVTAVQGRIRQATTGARPTPR